MFLAFLGKWLWAQVLLGWFVPLCLLVAPISEWSPGAVLCAVVLEVCLVALAYLGARSDLSWKRGPGGWG